MPFPFSTSSPLFVYKYSIEGGKKPQPANLARLRDLMHSQTTTTKLPESLAMSESHVWRWAWLDAENPVSAGGWIAFLCRTWVKKVPGSTVAALCEVREAAWCEEHSAAKIPKNARAEIKEDVVRDLTIKMPPAISDAAIAIDTLNHHLLLFASGAATRQAIVSRLQRTLEPMLGKGLHFMEWTLDHYLSRSRPGAALPAEIDHKWLGWLAQHGHRQEWLEVPSRHKSEPIVFRVTLEDKLRLMSDGGEISVRGDDAVDVAMRRVEEENHTRVAVLKLRIKVKGARSYVVVIDHQGRLMRVELVSGETYRAKSDNLESATLDRCDDYLQASKLVRLLMQAFDYGPMQDWIDEAPQTMLWPGGATAAAFWHSSDAIVDEDDAPPGTDSQQGLNFIASANLLKEAEDAVEAMIEVHGLRPPDVRACARDLDTMKVYARIRAAGLSVEEARHQILDAMVHHGARYVPGREPAANG